MRLAHTLLFSACISLVACGTKPLTTSDKHIQQSNSAPVTAGNIPQPSKRPVVLPPPKPAAKVETYSVVVTNLPAREILFALARDAKVNIDIHAGVQGEVTLNAINQTLPQILDRISRQVDMRYELDNGSLIVMPDSPYLKTYKIDYVNMSREADGGITNATQVGAGATGTGTVTTGGATSNNSQLSIKNVSRNHFWDTLIKNVTDILRETDKILPEGSSETVVEQSNMASTTGTGVQPAAGKKSVKPGIENSPNAATIEGEGTTITRRSTFREAASVIPNPEAGIITVRATGKQHEKIQEFLSHVMRNARRQVLIEATVAEVRLNSNYQQGINWSALKLGTDGFQLTQAGSAALPSTNTGSMFILNYANPVSRFGNLSASIQLLESFGDVKVLSSPKISVMNNQTAMLRVVDNLVYFTIKADTTANQTTTTTTFTTTAVTVPTGFTMSVTPQISDSDAVLLNLRPSITRLLGYVNDPNPALANPCGVGVTNCSTPAIVSRIPQLQTREMESVLKIENNQIAIMGGLMQDEINNLTDSIPLLGDVPVAGNLFKNRNDTKIKTELVIFLRPVVIKDASIDGDYSAYRNNLPDSNFLKPEDEKAKP